MNDIIEKEFLDKFGTPIYLEFDSVTKGDYTMTMGDGKKFRYHCGRYVEWLVAELIKARAKPLNGVVLYCNK